MWPVNHYHGLGKSERIYCLLFIVTIGIYVAGLFVPVMEIDAAQYASISDQMLHNKSFLEVKHRHFEYLDKPPLLFWIAALSIRIFGVNSFAYKLPSVLGLLLAVFSTYKFSHLYFKKEASLVAALVLASCQAFFSMANDCRTDNLLIGFSCLAIWQLASYIRHEKWINLVTGFIGTGLAMLAKGPLGLVFPALTIGSMLLVHQNYKTLSWKWLLAIPILSLLLLPMCVGLYRQHGMEGIEFYFWTQSFGRITGQSEWRNTTDPLFFVHTFFWSFIPFTIVFLPAIYSSFRDAIREKYRIRPIEIASIGGFILTMLALSFSRYKLPHYIFIVSPLAAIICAGYLLEKYTIQKIKTWYAVQCIFLLILLILSVLLIYYFNGSYPLYFGFAFLTILYLSWLIWKHHDLRRSIVMISVLAFAFVNLELNTLFYPRLLKYQSSSEVAFYIRDNRLNDHKIAGYQAYGHALSYYLDTIVPYYWDLEEVIKLDPGTLVYTNGGGLQELENSLIDFLLVKTFDDFRVTHLSLEFLNPETRQEVIEKRYLIQLHPSLLHKDPSDSRILIAPRDDIHVSGIS